MKYAVDKIIDDIVVLEEITTGEIIEKKLMELRKKVDMVYDVISKENSRNDNVILYFNFISLINPITPIIVKVTNIRIIAKTDTFSPKLSFVEITITE